MLSLELFLPLPSVEKFAKQANLASRQLFVRVFLLCSSWMYFFNGLSKVINLFEFCLWFIAKKTGLILWKIYKLLSMKIEEAATKMQTRLRTD